ncbi:FADH(2)-oxidizing methylenetetrahydrofolate--tRNA-(uracil(54)-C(5))-methyltransferase TrmFO [Desulforamulus hydrothermalis]|uniref:Methylenetetrahydrofolate--tRNA-(uracil-5-)-methyltransferase TrmFO n=1 Tax=Desulforamulus hydrothermalis Lam5 = DSM 18033 TaxID=1121428 RepID=K8ELV0_9FIRM|nr:FADH(2)-oxidizing methylenetetrahydrofolate--tRNA-(uracil(54)-C(5))-methyltransferase TrmFO [Desulforamulus hydrothermalis]CCO09451.1 Methylenetetrahydrofolate--tRNA-(uracil-5-)-methyltransferase TrmFO [Desulforamulus hydrothermalis Lam5 = DSM 18033]SHH07882.1 methylenetetrahydrofolate--tRNA-(uracil-5-)-methyltransferase [Desulforamulus hydrothermalis Lam5 = DSM 18033]
MTENRVTVIGAGLAGSEAAWQLARRGVAVDLYEMRPYKYPPAHHTPYFSELVCSNSLRAAALENAVGLLKEEMRQLNSLIIQAADAQRVPAGGALAVDREGFAKFITERLEQHPLVSVHRQEVTRLPERGIVIIASGPLTSEALSQEIARLTGEQYLYFYDAAAPIVTLESLDMTKIFRASRYGKGEEAYLNCPMTREEYDVFYEALLKAERVPLKSFEKQIHFEGCMPVEVLAARGKETLLYGPLKPVGLIDPGTGKRPYAVVQLRQDNAAGTLFNLVGFQTNLKWGEQQRVFRLIPGLEQAEFVRYGVMHRNTYINSPVLLKPTLQMKQHETIFFAGQITGVEGYVESAAAGLIAGINAARLQKGQKLPVFPAETAHGALINYITTACSGNFQPMNVTFGLFPELPVRLKGKKERGQAQAARALQKLKEWSVAEQI